MNCLLITKLEELLMRLLKGLTTFLKLDQISLRISSNSNFKQYLKNSNSEFTACHPISVYNVYRLLCELPSSKASALTKSQAKLSRLQHYIFKSTYLHIQLVHDSRHRIRVVQICKANIINERNETSFECCSFLNKVRDCMATKQSRSCAELKTCL